MIYEDAIIGEGSCFGERACQRASSELSDFVINRK